MSRTISLGPGAAVGLGICAVAASGYTNQISEWLRANGLSPPLPSEATHFRFRPYRYHRSPLPKYTLLAPLVRSVVADGVVLGVAITFPHVTGYEALSLPLIHVHFCYSFPRLTTVVVLMRQWICPRPRSYRLSTRTWIIQ